MLLEVFIKAWDADFLAHLQRLCAEELEKRRLEQVSAYELAGK